MQGKYKLHLTLHQQGKIQKGMLRVYCADILRDRTGSRSRPLLLLHSGAVCYPNLVSLAVRPLRTRHAYESATSYPITIRIPPRKSACPCSAACYNTGASCSSREFWCVECVLSASYFDLLILYNS